MSEENTCTAFAPASIGNIGVGFDVLGLAIAGVGDRVSARKIEKPGITIKEVRDPDGNIHPILSNKVGENTASIAARSLWDEHGDSNTGLELVVHKGVPLQSGMGSSATSAVAAVVAVNAFLDEALSPTDLLPHALAGEQYASGGLHADNVAPSLIGGMVLCPQVLLPRMIALSVPSGISSVLVHPELEVNTAESRSLLKKSVSMEQWVTQQGYIAGFVAACEQGNHELFAACLKDTIIEPQRSPSVPCFAAVKEAAMSVNAYGCSLSGSGPSIFALCGDADAAELRAAMVGACESMDYECQSWISPLNSPGAYIEQGG